MCSPYIHRLFVAYSTMFSTAQIISFHQRPKCTFIHLSRTLQTSLHTDSVAKQPIGLDCKSVDQLTGSSIDQKGREQRRQWCNMRQMYCPSIYVQLLRDTAKTLNRNTVLRTGMSTGDFPNTQKQQFCSRTMRTQSSLVQSGIGAYVLRTVALNNVLKCV